MPIVRSDGAEQRGDKPPRALVFAFLGLQLGMLISTMTATIVATAIPTIVDELGSITGIAWIVSAYLLAATASMPIYGKLGDIYGRKRIYMFSIGLFAIGSLLCGVSQTLPQLLAARAVQGLGAGGLGPLAMAILGDVVPPRRLGRWLGYQGAIFAVGGVLGPVMGGIFVDQLSWRWAFLANIPLALVSMGVVAVALKVPYRRLPHKIDFAGSALLTGSLIALVVLTTSAGDSFSWISPPSLALALLTVLLAVGFVLRQRRAAEPFVPLRLFDSSLVRVVAGLNITSGMLFFAGVIFLPIFFQQVSGVSATASGLLLAPLLVATAGLTLVAGRRVEATGRYRGWPIAGSVLMTLGVALLATLALDTPVVVASLWGGVLGAGVGCVMQTTLLALHNHAEPEDLGIATSTALLARTLGGTIGTPIFAAILAAGISDADASPADYADAMTPLFLAAVPVGVVSFFVARRLTETKLRTEARFAMGDDAAGGL